MITARTVKPSRGMTVVAMLVCLIVLTLISGAILKVSVAQREFARGQERRLQAEWLAESGTQRAIARLAGDHDYAGEKWSLNFHDLGQGEREHAPAGGGPSMPDQAAGEISIAVERVPAAPNRRRVRVRADYPLEASRRSRHTKEFTIDLKSSQKGATS